MTKIHFLQYTHYVIYDYEHDKELGIVTKSGMAFYDKLDKDDEELVKKFADSERETFKQNFMERFKTDHAMLFQEIVNRIPSTLFIQKEDWNKMYEDADYLYAFYMDWEKNYYEKLYERKHYRSH